jgi:hypothetical protein
MKQLTLYIDQVGRILTRKATTRLKKTAHEQWMLAMATVQYDTIERAAVVTTHQAIQKRALTDWDIALLQEQKRYDRYTVVVGRRVKKY